MIKSIRLKAIGIVAIAELLICMVLFCSVGLNSVPGFFKPDSSSVHGYVYLGHFIF